MGRGTGIHEESGGHFNKSSKLLSRKILQCRIQGKSTDMQPDWNYNFQSRLSKIFQMRKVILYYMSGHAGENTQINNYNLVDLRGERSAWRKSGPTG